MTMVEERLKQLGITLPDAQTPVANYVPFRRTGNLVYLSGVGPANGPDGTVRKGKLGHDMTAKEGYESARLTGLNVIARLKDAVGDLDKVTQFIKLLSMVNSAPDFVDQPQVANGCSDLLVEVFGDKGRHARSAVGMGALPGNIPIEIEAIIEVEG